jgi:hypothetical protein
VVPVPVPIPNQPNNPQPNNPNPPNAPNGPNPLNAPGSQQPGGSGGRGTGSNEPHGGNGGGSGSDNDGEPAQVASPLLQSPADSPVSLGRGPVSGDGFAQTPIPIIYTSKGIVKTSLSTPTGTLFAKGTAKGSSAGRGVPTAISIKPGATAGSGTGGGVAAPEQVAPNTKSTPIIAGVVTGVLAVAFICALLFFCARRRKRQPRDITPIAGGNTETIRDETTFGRQVRGMFSGRNSRNAQGDESPRSTTPALERGDVRAYVQNVDSSPRRRSSSEPANRLPRSMPMSEQQQRSMGPPILPLIMQEHRRSVSSVSGMAYPVLSDANNPFSDPDPNAQLRIVNPDDSRNGTPASTPRSRKPAFTPLAGVAAAGAAGGGLAGMYFTAQQSPAKKPSPLSPRGYHGRKASGIEDPFLDPEPLINPFADPFADPTTSEPVVANVMISSNHQKHSSIDSLDSESQYSVTPPRSRHSRNRTLTAVPLITKTAPSTVSSHQHTGSGDSGFASASSPGSMHSARFGGGGLGFVAGLFGRGANNPTSPQLENSRNLLPTSVPRSSPGMAPPVPQSSHRLSIPRGGAPTLSQTQRLSTTSSSSSLSLSFPSSWGSPGPTRPVSYATQNGSNAPPLPLPTRVSDPFDLDVPELLAYANSEVGTYSAVTLSRTGSERSARTEREAREQRSERLGPSGLGPRRGS